MIRDAILYSYRRPEMTEQAVRRLLNWNSAVRIHVSIDGLRFNATEQEQGWRAETILRTEKLAESNSNVLPHIWNVNDGLTAHGIRIFDEVFENTNATFSLEEDNLVSEEGLNFLASSTASSNNPGIATAFTSCEHLATKEDRRFTLFPEQWATALNLPIYEKFRELWFSKKIEKKVTAEMFSEHFKGNLIYRNLVVEKWHRIFLASVQDKSYGDALMTYAAFSLGTPYEVPINSLVKDLGSEDNRGLHPRMGQIINAPHNFTEWTSRDRVFCLRCEKMSTGISGNGFLHVAKFLGRNISSTIGLSEKQPQK